MELPSDEEMELDESAFAELLARRSTAELLKGSPLQHEQQEVIAGQLLQAVVELAGALWSDESHPEYEWLIRRLSSLIGPEELGEDIFQLTLPRAVLAALPRAGRLARIQESELHALERAAESRLPLLAARLSESEDAQELLEQWEGELPEWLRAREVPRSLEFSMRFSASEPLPVTPALQQIVILTTPGGWMQEGPCAEHLRWLSENSSRLRNNLALREHAAGQEFLLPQEERAGGFMSTQGLQERVGVELLLRNQPSLVMSGCGNVLNRIADQLLLRGEVEAGEILLLPDGGAVSLLRLEREEMLGVAFLDGGEFALPVTEMGVRVVADARGQLPAQLKGEEDQAYWASCGWLHQSSQERGLALRTSALREYGHPELELRNVPPALAALCASRLDNMACYLVEHFTQLMPGELYQGGGEIEQVCTFHEARDQQGLPLRLVVPLGV